MNNHITETDMTDKVEVTQADIEAWEIIGPAIFHSAMQGAEALAKYRQQSTAQLQAEREELVEALQRAYDSVLKDAPAWFEDGSPEQKAMQVEANHARALLAKIGDAK